MHRAYRRTNLSRTPQLADSFLNRKDLLSQLPGRLAERPFLVFVSILVLFLFLSIACDRVLADVESGATQTPSAIQQDSGSTYLNVGVEAATVPRPGAADRSAFSIFADGLELDSWNSSWFEGMATLAFRLTLAAVLGALVAFRPRRPFSLSHRNPPVVQSQILLTVVACALMMIIGDSAARAFGIFAAAALVRFRTNIRDPKEITILLINLGIGLAAGVGRWELASIFTLFVLLLLQLLESYEHHQVGNLMELKLRTHDVDVTDGAVRELLRRNNLDVDIRRLNKQSDKHPLGKVVYSVGIGPKLNTDRLGEEIYLADPINIAGVEWRRKKTRPPAYRA